VVVVVVAAVEEEEEEEEGSGKRGRGRLWRLRPQTLHLPYSKQAEVPGHIVTTFPCHVPRDQIMFTAESKTNQKYTVFNLKHTGLVGYNIRFAVEWPDFETISFPSRLPGRKTQTLRSCASFKCRA
jgi:hypothetical protein